MIIKTLRLSAPPAVASGHWFVGWLFNFNRPLPQAVLTDLPANEKRSPAELPR
jgi:hypothetical protein